MRSNNSAGIDGFVRRRRGTIGQAEESTPIPERFLVSTPEKGSRLKSPSSNIVNRDVQDILNSLPEDNEPDSSGRLHGHKKKRDKKNHSTKRKWIIRVVLVILVIVLCVAGYLAVKAFLITDKVFNGGNILSLITPGTPLKTDSQGRTNIVLLGTSQDDSAHQDASGGGGLWLTDSIELMSINQKAKTVKLVGIPRDLWVALQNCNVGYYAKINAVYECGANLQDSSGTPGSNYSTQDTAGAQQLMTTIGQVTGITPQYFVHADYTVLKQAVDAVGGVDVNIVGDGASGIYDTNFDWDCPKGPYTCKNVYYPNNGVYHLDGTQALFLSRARADGGIYSYKDFGLAQGDFDRQANQQKILIALQAKVKSASVLANPVTLNNLLDAFGNNISMDLSGGEVKTLLTFTKSLPNSAISQVSLVQSGSAVVTTGEVDGQSVVLPVSGTYDYSSIINYLAKQLSTNPAVAEGANIGVYNASGVAGAAANEQTKIQQLGLTVDTVGDAASADAGSGTYTLYDQSKGKMPKTLAQLQTTLGVKATTAALPADITSADNFVIVIN
jgi:anionic cell wall polymer biosynthesis LytR-Cps2A-Psr (LCP) family protein